MLNKREKGRIVQALHLLKREKWKQWDERYEIFSQPDFKADEHKAFMNSMNAIERHIDEIKALIVKINQFEEE